MRTKIIMLWIIMVTAVPGCYETSDVYKKTYEVSALANLKNFQMNTTMYYEEKGKYGRLQDLYEWSGGEIEGNFYRAWDGHENPEPLGEYLYSNLDEDESGAPLDRRSRVGLCAYPAKPGKTGDKIFCALADMSVYNAMQGMEDRGFVSGSEEWTIYAANYQDVSWPVRKWPTRIELNEKFRPLKKLSPQEGLRKARQLFDSVQENQFNK